MSENKPHLYINSKGYFVTRHSYSGSESYNYCARKYYLERVQGWHDKEQRSSTAFGIALEHAITYWHQHNEDTEGAVAEFVALWAESKDKPLTYTKGDLDWNRLNLTGQEMVRLYTLRYPEMPYVVDQPMEAFQVERNMEVFPGSRLQGISFTAYLDIVATLKETGEHLVVDCKTSAKRISPDFTALDPQLRSYAWITGWPNVAFLNFVKMGRTISRGDSVTILQGENAGQERWVLGVDDFGVWLTDSQEVVDELAQFADKKKATEEARQKYVEEHGKLLPERFITKQRLFFQRAIIPPDSVEDIGRAIKRDIVNIVKSTELNLFPMQSGIRFPNEKCPNCPMRGICANRPELRDALVERKQIDELDFGKAEE